MIKRNIAQKHISTARTDRTLDSSATDTSIAVIATNIIKTANTKKTKNFQEKREFRMPRTNLNEFIFTFHLKRPKMSTII